MTGLSLDVEEPLNIQHYGVGGPFWDQRIKRHKMAMILFYVSDYFAKVLLERICGNVFCEVNLRKRLR